MFELTAALCPLSTVNTFVPLPKIVLLMNVKACEASPAEGGAVCLVTARRNSVGN